MLKSYRLGEKRVMNNGLEAEIIAYRGRYDIDVRFSNGVIRYNNSYVRFTKGSISDKIIDYSSRVGEKRVMNNGLEAEIIAYRRRDDIDVRFSSGVIRCNVRYNSFIRGSISDIIDYSSRVGEKRVMNNGLEAEIIAYRKRNDIDVRFSNGVIRYNRSYDYFIKGVISDKNTSYFSKLGEKRVMNNGLEAEIIAYRGCNDIDIRFEDDYKRSCDYGNFSNGCIEHDTLKLCGISVTKGSTLGNFNVLKLAYRLEDLRVVYYICECTKCKLKDILSPREMLDHKC